MDDDHPRFNGEQPPGDRRSPAGDRRSAPGDRSSHSGELRLPAALVRLRERWSGLYSITCADGIWSAYYLRTAEEFHARSPRSLDAKIRSDYARRLEIRPGAPERMST
jgi:hypothetical protein